jgi:hypothetical protein
MILAGSSVYTLLETLEPDEARSEEEQGRNQPTDDLQLGRETEGGAVSQTHERFCV